LNFWYQLISSCALWSRKPTENLDPVGRSQDLPDADCLLTFKQTNPNGSPHCAVENLQMFGTDILVTVRWEEYEALQHSVNVS